MTWWQRAAGIALVLGVAASATIVLLVWPRLFHGTPAGAARLVGARCEGGDAACAAKVIEIGPRRYWVEASSPQAHGLVLDFEPASPVALLLLGAGAPALTASAHCGQVRIDGEQVGGGPRRRRLVRLETTVASCRPRVIVQREGATSPGTAERLRLEEVGLFTSERGLLEDPRFFLTSQPDRRVYHGILARVCLALALIGVLAASFVPADPSRWLVATFAFCLALAAASLEVWLYYNPYFHGSRDLAVALASGPVQEGVGSNLNYGMYLGSRLLSGEGLTFGPGWVPWERTPGYAFFCAAGGLLAGYKTDLLTIGLYSIRLHLLFSAAAAALFVAAASRVMGPPVALAVAAVITFMPNQLANTQVDSIMVGVYLLTAAALCLYLDKSRGGAMPPPRYHLLVHLAFATWFLMRPDGLAGWMAISLVLYWRTWRWLALPARACARDRAFLGCLQVPLYRRVLDDHEHGGAERVDRPVAGAEQVPVADGRRELFQVRGSERRSPDVKARQRRHRPGGGALRGHLPGLRGAPDAPQVPRLRRRERVQRERSVFRTSSTSACAVAGYSP